MAANAGWNGDYHLTGVNPTKHKLCAILFADIVGYSLLTESVALQFRGRMLKLAHENLPRHGGRLVKTQGDDILAEFSSATDAVKFGMALQDQIAEQNAAAGLGQKLRLRIGIHVGDVVVEGDDILGDAVNTAKRTESLAAPGGICMTESVWEEVHEHLPRSTWKLGRISGKHGKSPLVSYHFDPPGAGWSYRLAHRVRLEMGRPLRFAALSLIFILGIWAAVLWSSFLKSTRPADPAKLMAMGKSDLSQYFQAGAVDRAIQELQQLPDTQPYAEARGYLALAYWRSFKETGELKTRTDADIAAAKSLAANKDIPVAHYVRGLLAQDRQDWLAASNEFFRADTLERNVNGLYLIALANVCHATGDEPRAEEYVQKALGVPEKDWEFYHELAKYYFLAQKDDAALTNGLQAIKLSPNNSFAECNVAAFYLSRTDSTNYAKEAWEHLERAGKARATANYYQVLGHYYQTFGENDKALESFEKAAREKPKDYWLWGTAGYGYHEAANEAKATELLNRAVAEADSVLQDTRDCVVLARKGLYLAVLRRAKEALPPLQEALGGCPENSAVRATATLALGELTNTTEGDTLQHLLDAKH